MLTAAAAYAAGLALGWACGPAAAAAAIKAPQVLLLLQVAIMLLTTNRCTLLLLLPSIFRCSCRAGTGLGVFEVDLLLQREYGYGLDGNGAAANGA
jgi:hypothetical protein